jgi:peptidoglycan/LPS O-acetylase OafA/YrhL
VTARVRGRTREDGVRDPRLDGIRGIAILLVLLCHLTQFGGLGTSAPFLDRAWRELTLPLGFGVDLFFVLSGFLITGILLDTRESAGYFRVFYARRILRIFPLYYATLLVLFLVLPTPPREPIWYWTYLTNHHFAEVGWPKIPYLGHFWSLAVEEQFYLLWPAVVFFLPRRALPWFCLCSIALSTSLRIHAFQEGEPIYARLATHLRLDGLAMGGMLACIARQPGGLRRWRGLVSGVGAAATVAVLVMLVRGGHTAPDIAGYALMQTATALMFGAGLALSVTTGPGAPLHRWLTARWLRRVGLYSYSLYVLHAPIIVWLGRHQWNARLFPEILGSRLPGLLLWSACVGAFCIALSALSYHQFERRFLALKRFVPYTKPPTPPQALEDVQARAV